MTVVSDSRRVALLSAVVAGVCTTFACGNISASAQENVVVTLGDSNTSGRGVAPEQAFPARMENILRTRDQSALVINAGVAGDTFGAMLGRLDLAVPEGTKMVIVQGGYNDLADGVPPAQTVANLNEILARLHARHIKTVLCGFFYPKWDAIGRRLAASNHATFVSGSTCYAPQRRGPDQLHMSEAGHEVVAGRLARVVRHLDQHVR